MESKFDAPWSVKIPSSFFPVDHIENMYYSKR